MYTFDTKQWDEDHRDFILAEIADACLNGKEGTFAAQKLADNFAVAMLENQVFPWRWPRLLHCLAKSQPIIFLDVFLDNNDLTKFQRNHLFDNDFKLSGNPLNQIHDEEIISWCEKDATIRYPIVISTIEAFKKSETTDKLEWKPIVYTILEKAPDLDAVLENLANTIPPRSWGGSRAAILESRAVLFQELYEHENAKIRDWAKSQLLSLQDTIKQFRNLEESLSVEQNERFE